MKQPVIVFVQVRANMASSSGHCDWLFHPWRTTASDQPVQPRVSSCDVQGQPAVSSEFLMEFSSGLIRLQEYSWRDNRGCFKPVLCSHRLNWCGNEAGFTCWMSLPSLPEALVEADQTLCITPCEKVGVTCVKITNRKKTQQFCHFTTALLLPEAHIWMEGYVPALLKGTG